MSASRYTLKDDPYSSHAVILSRLGPGHGRRVLDVGAGDGFLAERLTAAGWRVTALEQDAQQAELARPKCAAVVVADLERGVPELDGAFDAVVCGDVLEHLADPLRALRALADATGADGRVIVSVPNVAHLWVRLSLLLGRFQYGDRGILDRTHLRFFTLRTCRELLSAASLRVEEIAVTPVPLPLLVPPRLQGAWLRALHALSAGLARCWKRGLAYQFVAVCRPRPRRAESDARGHPQDETRARRSS